MSDFATYVQFGFRHIVDVEAMDHILFLLALAAIYRWRDTKSALWVVTAFTLGHSVTLGLAVTKLVQLPTSLIEFLIPLTIVVTGNHFVLDAVAGIAVMGAGFLTVNWWRSRNRESNSRVCAA